jgi:glutaredoxin
MRDVPVLELYGAASCPFTAEMRSQLEYEGRPFVEYDLETDDAARIRLVTMTGQRMVPTLVQDGRVIAVGWHGRVCLV